MTMLLRLICFIRRRHNYRLRGRDGRMFMECGDCGYRSHGLEMGPKARPLAQQSTKLRLWLDDAVSLPPAADSGVALESLGAPSSRPDELRLQLDS